VFLSIDKISESRQVFYLCESVFEKSSLILVERPSYVFVGIARVNPTNRISK